MADVLGVCSTTPRYMEYDIMPRYVSFLAAFATLAVCMDNIIHVMGVNTDKYSCASGHMANMRLSIPNSAPDTETART